MKKTTLIVLVAILAVVGLTVLWVVQAYNNFVTLEVAVETKWADVEASYQRRLDLISNLVSTVKGAASFEQTTLIEIVEARSNALGIKLDPKDLTEENLARFKDAQNSISGSLSRLLAIVENYPQLQSVQAFRDLQVQLEGTENRINVTRIDYNASVQKYNKAVRSFPAVLFAGMLGFSNKVLYEADSGAENAPKVDFGNN